MSHYAARITDERNIRYHECDLFETYEEALEDGKYWAGLLRGWHFGYQPFDWGTPVVTVFEVTNDRHVYRLPDRKEHFLPSQWIVRFDSELNRLVIRTAEAGNALLERWDRLLQEEVLTATERECVISFLAGSVRREINVWAIMDKASSKP